MSTGRHSCRRERPRVTRSTPRADVTGAADRISASMARPRGAERDVAAGPRAAAEVEIAAARGTGAVSAQPAEPPLSPAPPRRSRWAELLQRVLAVDVLVCPKCGAACA